MRVLIVSDMPPYPPVSGTPLRLYNLLRRISSEHEVTLLTMWPDGGEAEGIVQMQKLCRAVLTVPAGRHHGMERSGQALKYLLQGKPPMLRFYDSPELKDKLRQVTSSDDYDVVEIVNSYMGLSIDNLTPRLRGRSILTFIDVVFSKTARISRIEQDPGRRLRLLLQAQIMRQWELRYAQRFARCITVSEPDRRLLQAANPRLQVEVIPNGVDTDKYRPLPWAEGPPACIFVGNMEYTPNAQAVVSFCRESFPRIQRLVGNVQMWIVGINPPPEVMRLDGDCVHVTGRVDDVRPFYSRSTVSVVPLQAGAGTRLKILEAMALGRPVVSTPIGYEGLDAVDGEHLLVAGSPVEMAEKTARLLLDENLRQRIAVSARQLVVDKYDWDSIAKRLIRVYRQVADGGS